MKLKNLGVYALPDGREFIADVISGGKYRLCSSKTWNFTRISEYLISAEGRLLDKRGPTTWGIEHLIDTGRSVRYPKASHV
jgi:hypothetical protein